jgi:acyl-CoA thioester hydrolase
MERFSRPCLRRERFSLVSTDISKPYAGTIIGSTHYFAVRVYIEDTDLGGVVYHANYLRFMERARSDLLRSLGINQRAALESGLGVYAVTEMHLRYCLPAKLEDDLVVISDVEEIRGASCVVRQRIVRENATLVEASVTLAFVSSTGRPKRHPPEWVEKFKQVQAAPGSSPVCPAISPGGRRSC